MVVINYAAIGANGNINTCFLKVFIPLVANIYKGGSLSAADTFCFSCDTDGAAADTDLYKIGAAFRQKAEARGINNIARAHLYAIAVGFSYPGDGELLPIGKALG